MDSVLEFSLYAGRNIPRKAEKFSDEGVKHISRMIIDEMYEFLSTVYSEDEIEERFVEMVRDRKKFVPIKDKFAEQVDALEDIKYYISDFEIKHGVNGDEVHKIIHAANMNKLLKRGDRTIAFVDASGKVLKPQVGWSCGDGSFVTQEEEWQKPDVSGCMAAQMEDNGLVFEIPNVDVIVVQ